MLSLMNRRPFKPFEIQLADGAQICVEQPFQIAAQPNSPVCFVLATTTKCISFRIEITSK